jgi:hypothetical protein
MLQVRGIFRGGLATLFREAIGNAFFFCTYEYSRYWMHNYIDSRRFSDNSHLVVAKDVGIGVMSGGISGMAVSISIPFKFQCKTHFLQFDQFSLRSSGQLPCHWMLQKLLFRLILTLGRAETPFGF